MKNILTLIIMRIITITILLYISSDYFLIHIEIYIFILKVASIFIYYHGAFHCNICYDYIVFHFIESMQ